LSQPTPAPEPTARTSESQLFCCKSIDKLITDSEHPDRKLKKTLGPVSLTALGIGAVIGSGIFTVIGTAIAGQKFDTSSILNAPLLDYLIRHTASTGRPGAGNRALKVKASGVGPSRNAMIALSCRTGAGRADQPAKRSGARGEPAVGPVDHVKGDSVWMGRARLTPAWQR